jgi:hypothetical protein
VADRVKAWLTVDEAEQDMVEARAVRITDALKATAPSCGPTTVLACFDPLTL